MAAGSARLLRPLILRDLLVALENAEIHNERLTGQCFLDPKSQKEEAPVPQPALKLQKNCCAASASGWKLTPAGWEGRSFQHRGITRERSCYTELLL